MGMFNLDDIESNWVKRLYLRVLFYGTIIAIYGVIYLIATL